MITKDNFSKVLEALGFKKDNQAYYKKFTQFECELRVDFKNEKLIYPEEKGLIVNDKTTSNFSSSENFVVFECVCRLLSQGYHPKHIELEKRWQLGHLQKSGKADILVKDNSGKSLLIIECKTAGHEYEKAIKILENDARNQLFSYLQQEPSTKFLALYTSDFIDEKLVPKYYLISVSDNEELLKNNPKLKSYKDASTAEEKYQVWCETYGKEYATIGLFEDNKPYEIGKRRWSIKDLKSITSKDIQGKYHEFTTILRQHNVSGRENAFDKLVNLFLCKVTDEIENPDELKFYWKGKVYDDPFDFQDRLQQLYKIGMEKFLGDEITYIANNKIDEAFEVFKDRPNATKDKIKEFVKQLKFFTNNDFAFIDVHNEKLFYQNFAVLLKVAKMIQDIRLRDSEENQFLGDMFENFLDQGIKQSEGQYFTPLPIVKFIINSLPDKDNPNVIDYACGAGHFLNEYAILNKNSHIVGIEKEYRLSKVAKVSSFMYGNEIEIIYADALSSNKKIKNNNFDVLISNPPYSVKGFLQTLSQEDRENYDLFKNIDSKSYATTNAIECFFIERAKQLLKKDGVASIIVPSSILNKNTSKLYIKTREIILKYFDILAIVEFGSETFSKTGTRTVTLFLRRRGENPDLSIHYKNMVEAWFECNFKINQLFKDDDAIKEYCKHIKIDFDIYKKLLCNELDEEILKHETFKEYEEAFKKLHRKFEIGEFIKFIKEKEKEKLYYFMLASKQVNSVIIVKTPSKTSEAKKFLGYEWIGRKGNEGIKYLTSNAKFKNDKDFFEKLQELKNINTPLYNPSNFDDDSKINKIIKDNFQNKEIKIPQNLKEYVSKAKLIDMIDFSRVDFNKAINLTPHKKIEIQSKWELEKLEKVIVENPKSKIKVIEAKELKEGFPFFTSGENIYKFHKYLVDGENLFLSTGGNFVIKYYDGKASYSTDTFSIKGNSRVKTKYLYELLNSISSKIDTYLFKGSGLKHLQKDEFKNIKIPLPSMDIQKKIIEECQIVDDEVTKAYKIIKNAKEKIKKEFELLDNRAKNSYRLSDEKIFDIFIGQRVLSNEIYDYEVKGSIPVFSANVYKPFGYIKKYLINDFSLDSILWGIDGDWMVNIIEKNKPFYPTDHCGVIRIKTNDIEPLYFRFAFEKEGKNRRFSRAFRASIQRIKSLDIKLPSIKEQKNFANMAKELMKNISKAQKIIDEAPLKREKILKSYL